MISFFDVLNLNTTLWDVIEFKLIILFATVVLAVLLGNYLYDRTNR